MARWLDLPRVVLPAAPGRSSAGGGGPERTCNALSHQLHQEAKSATTFEQLNQVLTKISQLRSRGPGQQVDKYLADLQAWVLHRRGEAYVKQAAEANAANQAEVSRQLDRKAMEDFDAAIKLDPQRWKSYHHRGVCYALDAQFEKALERLHEDHRTASGLRQRLVQSRRSPLRNGAIRPSRRRLRRSDSTAE